MMMRDDQLSSSLIIPHHPAQSPLHLFRLLAGGSRDCAAVGRRPSLPNLPYPILCLSVTISALPNLMSQCDQHCRRAAAHADPTAPIEHLLVPLQMPLDAKRLSQIQLETDLSPSDQCPVPPSLSSPSPALSPSMATKPLTPIRAFPSLVSPTASPATETP